MPQDTKQNEVRVPMRAFAVKYKCEFCGEGEQMAITDEMIQLDLNQISKPQLVAHRCNKCGKEMMLPRPYPYLEWVEDKE